MKETDIVKRPRARGTPPPQELLDIIAERMNELGWIPFDLAKAAGKSHSTIYEMLSGKSTPNPATLTQIAAALGISDLKMKVAAGYVARTEVTEIDLMLSDLRLALLQLPPDKRPTALAAARGMITGMVRAGQGEKKS